jgi:hypothetical protein
MVMALIFPKKSDAAHLQASLDQLVKAVNDIGNGEIWIECDKDKGYALRFADAWQKTG